MVLRLLRPADNLQVNVAPSPAHVVLDGQKTISTGNYHISIGSHTLRATMDGFAPLTRTFTTSSKLTTIYLVLQPNSTTGYAYFKAHPDEERRWEGMSTQNFSTINQQIVNNNPIIKILPHTASDNSYRIDYGATKNSKTQIYITAISDTAVETAKNWIASKGYNPSVLRLQSSIEPMLNHLPYKTTDYTLVADFTSGINGEPKLTVDATLRIAAADAGNTTVINQYKQEVASYISSFGLSPANYTINYTVQNG